MTDAPTAFFWEVARSSLEEERVQRSTMMGFPCLRVDGRFFASVDHRTGDLIVKLPASRVQAMIQSGAGQPFAPAGRRFREWVLLSDRDVEQWTRVLQEAFEFATAT